MEIENTWRTTHRYDNHEHYAGMRSRSSSSRTSSEGKNIECYQSHRHSSNRRCYDERNDSSKEAAAAAATTTDDFRVKDERKNDLPRNINLAAAALKDIGLNSSTAAAATIQYPTTLKDLIDGLYKIFDDGASDPSEKVDIDQVQALMSAYKSNPAEWLKYAKFDRYRYTRNLVDAGNGKFNLMILCWGEGHGSSIHDHANAHCVMKILAGNLCEVRFKWPELEQQKNPSPLEPATLNSVAAATNEQPSNDNGGDTCCKMKEISRTVLPTNGICYINDSQGLHRVENLSYSDCAVSLHLYSPPFDTCKVFNERTGRSVRTTSTFWSVYGKRRKDKVSAPASQQQNNISNSPGATA